MIDMDNFFKDNNCVRIETSEDHILVYKEEGKTYIAWQNKLKKEESRTVALGEESPTDGMYFGFKSPRDEDLRTKINHALTFPMGQLAEEFVKEACRVLVKDSYLGPSFTERSDLRIRFRARMDYVIDKVIDEVLNRRGL